MSKLSFEQISMRFGEVQALEDVSFSLEEGHIYGLLGRNGAGKSTLLSLAAGWRRPTAGRVLLDGAPVWENAAAMGHIVCTSDGNMFPALRVGEGLRWYAQYRPSFSMERAQELCDIFELRQRAKIISLSTGYASIFKLIVAMASQAEFTFFDEPVLGLDANHRDIFYRELTADFARLPRCIIISTHLIEECAELLDRVVILKKGKLLLDDSVENTLARGYSVSGPAARVDGYLAGKKLLGVRSLGGLKTAYVEGSPQPEGAEGLEFGALDLQQLFIQLTNS